MTLLPREERSPPTGYIIDVCATCGRHAVWPFSCGHRSTRRAWTVAIHVVPTQAAKTRLKEAMGARELPT